MLEVGVSKYKRLWFKVLKQAIFDIQFHHPRRDRYIKDEVTAWFKNDENKNIKSFLWICELLELDPEYIREQILPKDNKARVNICLPNKHRPKSLLHDVLR